MGLETNYLLNIAADLAENGRGNTSPNPLVGAVIVKDGTIVGQGYHEKVGEAHAEVNAINEAGSNCIAATLVCTLEPCSHFGRTPPCTNKIIESGITKVVIGMLDPNSLVSGRGVKSLTEAGIKVEVYANNKKLVKQNEEYLKYISSGLPFVTLKTAVSSDGKISKSRMQQTSITGEQAQKYVHKLRSFASAIITGIGTVECDDPMLNVRLVNGNNPLRAILDSEARISLSSKIVKSAHQIKTWLVVSDKADGDRLEQLHQMGLKIIKVKNENQYLNLNELLKLMGKSGISNVLIEAGSKVNTSFLRNGLIDKLIVLEASSELGESALNAFDGIDWQFIKRSYLQNQYIEYLGSDKLYDIDMTAKKTGFPEVNKCSQV